MKRIIPALLFTISMMLYVTSYATSLTYSDTVVAVTGKVIAKEGKEPLKSFVEYKRLPYGNEVGKISSNDNGEFTIYVKGDGSYSITVVSEGYFAHSEEFNVNYELSNKGAITRNIELEAGDVGYVFTLNNLTFELGQSAISPESFNELDMVVSRLNQFPLMEIQLEGHTDTRGNADQNMNLSQERVDAVKGYIVGKGIQENRIKTRAFGGTKPLSTEDTEEAHASNRRVEVRILKVE